MAAGQVLQDKSTGFVSWHGTDYLKPRGANVLGQLVVRTISWVWSHMGWSSHPGSGTY